MARTNTQTQLVYQHLERMPRKALEKYQHLIGRYVKRRRGIYALYRGERLYYVGLASNLNVRLKHHLRDRHADTWDRFSVYLTTSAAKYLRELESLVLRVASPGGNRQKGRFARSEDLRRQFRRDVAAYQQMERSTLLGDGNEPEDEYKPAPSAAGRKAVLARYVKKRMKLRLENRGKTYWALVRKDGRIKVGKKLFTSPSLAGKAVLGRAVSGWTEWSYERAPGDWVLLDELRH